MTIFDEYQKRIKLKKNLGNIREKAAAQGKINILAWTDCPTTTTGFGVVARYVLDGLYRTGKYNIDVLAINFFDDLHNMDRSPYHIYPARLDNPKDPYGKKTFLKLLQSGKYQIVWIQNDSFTMMDVAGQIAEIRSTMASKGSPFKVIFYYPVDCRLRRDWTAILNTADKTIGYSNFVQEETEKLPGIKYDMTIPIGINTSVFKPLSPEEKLAWRQEYFRLEHSSNKYIVMNLNRNSLRKDLAKTIFCFNEFKKSHPEALLYLHTAVVDAGAGNQLVVDLRIPCENLGLEIGKDVIFPMNFNPSKGVSEIELNRLYNCADCFISTDLGEGLGQSRQEAMATGLPVILPWSSTTPELLGDRLTEYECERGFTYPCKEPIYVDLSGYRYAGRIEDILNALEQCYLQRSNSTKQTAARKFMESRDWKLINPIWDQVITKELKETNQSQQIGMGITL